ncbi:hypothetical protein O0I10_004643 [Lichtheimia ornata]|uniref:Ricin B lectin domain-containing protein n=1 Tax=Lichtheimia ornata TaxID=688661 RepID=A0AAD7V5D7_9FUNG|nr:uncharacterized protein O0I10_004643 [Lichtheimia ornata]KAJ8659664.1 hypothetical protein O0I10_004643 [Lichtheimia ornata]
MKHQAFPTGWFYIQANTHPQHVLTVVDKSWQPGARIELRPPAGEKKHQQWTYSDGFLVNRLSGCVMSVKQAKTNQPLVQGRRLPKYQADTQRWQYGPDNKITLQVHPSCSLNTQQVPRLVVDGDEEQDGWSCIEELVEQAERLSL